LKRSKGKRERGGSPGGEAWKIEVNGKRAGVVFINLIDEPPIGRHASIQIYLNTPSQGRGIGRLGYRKACEASTYQTIHAHMRKSNAASRRAAEAAGFEDVTPSDVNQLIMVWRHRSSTIGFFNSTGGA
jgi:RimJ/RimL family protein N-acetyltransferase